MDILLPNDRNLSRQDRFNNYARSSIGRLSIDVIGLQHMFLALKEVLNINDETMDKAMKSVADQVAKLKSQVPEGAESAVHNETQTDSQTEDIH